MYYVIYIFTHAAPLLFEALFSHTTKFSAQQFCRKNLISEFGLRKIELCIARLRTLHTDLDSLTRKAASKIGNIVYSMLYIFLTLSNSNHLYFSQKSKRLKKNYESAYFCHGNYMTGIQIMIVSETFAF